MKTRFFAKGEVRQILTKAEREKLPAYFPSAPQSHVWPDGTPKSLNNEFNWRTGEPSIFMKFTLAEQEQRRKDYIERNSKK